MTEKTIEQRLADLEALMGKFDKVLTRFVPVLDTPERPCHKNKPRVVSVVRYVRPTDCDNRPYNLGGITLAFELDYDRMVAKVGWSICAEDENFDKVVGQEIAWKRLYTSDHFEMRLPVSRDGLVINFMKNVLGMGMGITLTECRMNTLYLKLRKELLKHTREEIV